MAAYCQYDLFASLIEHEWRVFHDTTALWKWVSAIAEKHDKTTIVAHNVDYDARLAHAFQCLPRLSWSPAWCVMSGSCNIFAFSQEKRSLVLLDNLNLFPVSLAALGQSVGFPKLEVDFETVPEKELLRYCERDVRIMVEAWRTHLDFLDRHDLGDFGLTIAAQTFNAYRHKYMPGKIGIHIHAEVLKLERASYRGGRSECFYVGNLPPAQYYKIDVNGLYAAMMSWFPYPSKLVKMIHNVTPAFLSELLKRFLIIAEVIIETDTPCYPVRVKERNTYPTGSFITTLTTPELENALLQDEIRGIGRVALYTPEDLFSDYIAFLTPLRQKYKTAGDLARSEMCKRLRNSLQGKFGQRGYKQKILGEAPLDQVSVRFWIDAETGEEATDWTFGGVVLRQWREGEAYDSFPAIPAHVNAYGRMYMWSLIEKAGRRNVFYIDTDGLIVNQAGLDRLRSSLDNLALGKLKIEGIASSVAIRARKDYRFGQREVIKGIKKNARAVGDDTFDQWHFTTLRYAFASRCLEGVTLHEVRKELKRGQVAGTIGVDGWVTPPRVTLSRDQVRALEPADGDSRSWIWEVDQEWLKNHWTRDVFRWELGNRLTWLDSPVTSSPLPLRRVVPF